MAGGIKQIIVQPAGVPGAANSVYSAKKTSTTVAATTGTLVITDIGFIQPLALPTGIVVQLQDPAATWTTIVAAGGTGLFFSDGTNLRFANTSAATVASYYVIQ